MTSPLSNEVFTANLDAWAKTAPKEQAEDYQNAAYEISVAFFNNLKELDISSRALATLPSALGELKSVKVLRINGNVFEGGKIPEVVFSLTGLTDLYANFSGLTELSKNIGNLVNVTNLRLNENKIIMLPDELGNLKETTVLDLTDNPLTIVPNSIGKFKKLKELYIKEFDISNQDAESLSHLLGTLINVKVLRVCGKIFDEKKIPEEVFALTGLTELYINSCRFTKIPESIGKLVNLNTLDISNNDMTTLPDELEKLVHVKELRIGGNAFAGGKIPSVVFTLIGLTDLYANLGKVTEVSKDVGNLVNLHKLNLSDNDITTLPEEIGRLVKLKEFYLYSNMLVAIPQTIGNLESLKELYLGAGVIEELPAAMGDLKSLETLHIVNTKNLTSLPMTMKKCAKLRTILIDEMDPNPFLVADRSAILSK